ncbi:MAG: lysophospholipid acyltransferase family protein [Muribaculum sp.]|nr:lysophospholipid acyltransferase family protein [Muribaculaceae bacterium]MCM1080227.1 lysophospholipid acyltransferase family protein [Muribaculum sp.]
MTKKRSDIIYLPLKWMLGAVSRLPFGVLYAIADVIFFLAYHVVHYRRKLVKKNLCESFPEKSVDELTAIERQFYRNFADYIVETIKLNHVSDSEIKERMEIVGIETVDRLFDEKRSIAMMFSHCFNWEWAPSITLWSRYKPSDKVVYAQVYRHLKNPWFNDYFLKLRSRFGSESYDKRVVLRHLLQLRRAGVLNITGFMSDQKPSHGDTLHVVNFLNHPTAMITGTETLARKLDMAVLYWDVEKPSRGHYRLTVKLVAEHPADLPEFGVTDSYARLLEQTIRRTPANWLWTHNRWKHRVEIPLTENSKATEK